MTDPIARPTEDGGYVVGDGYPDAAESTQQQGPAHPVLPAAIILAVVQAILGVLVAFGVPLTDVQVAAVMALAGAVTTAVLAVVALRSTAEYVAKGLVIRGEANEGTTGEVVRPAGSLAELHDGTAYDPLRD